MKRLLLITTLALSALAQTPPAAPARPPRTPPPTRDPNTPGYVKAKELPDGTLPSPKQNGNFIIGPTHNPDPAMTVQPGVPQGTVIDFTMESKDSKIYPGIARERNTFPRQDPADPTKLVMFADQTAYALISDDDAPPSKRMGEFGDVNKSVMGLLDGHADYVLLERRSATGRNPYNPYAVGSMVSGPQDKPFPYTFILQPRLR